MFAALLAALALAQAAEGQASETVRAIVAEGGHQTELPARLAPTRRSPGEADAEQEEGVASSGGGALRGDASRRDAPARRIPAPQVSAAPLFGVLGVLFWVLVAVAVVWAVIQALRAWRTGGAGAVAPPAAPRPEPEVASAPEPALDRVAELEREGRFGEAMHELLLLAFHELVRGDHGGQASTSRELARALALKGERRTALHELVLSVERWLFGGVAPDRGDLERCRAWYATLRAGGERA